MVFQVIHIKLNDEAVKKIKGKVVLSDGVSKIFCMLSDTVYNKIVRAGDKIEQWSVWSLDVSKQHIQIVQNKP